MELGDFYVSIGVVFCDLEIQFNWFLVVVEVKLGVGYKIIFIGCEKGEIDVRVLYLVEGEKVIFDLIENFFFVWCKIIFFKLQENFIEIFVYEMAWIQFIQLKQIGVIIDQLFYR